MGAAKQVPINNEQCVVVSIIGITSKFCAVQIIIQVDRYINSEVCTQSKPT